MKPTDALIERLAIEANLLKPPTKETPWADGPLASVQWFAEAVAEECAKAPKPRGRPVVPEADRLHIYNIRLTRAQIEKLAVLGGAVWIRQKIEQARRRG